MPKSGDYLTPRDELMQTMDRIYRYRMTTTSGGNLSIREPNGDVWITPARVDKGTLRRDDMVCVKPSGAIEGKHRPSSEFPFHRAIYEARPDLGAVVHAHPVALVAFSIFKQPPNTLLFHQSKHVCGAVGFALYALPGSEALGRNIAQAFAEGNDCVLLENHGVVVGGTNLQAAFQRFETLEFTAKTIIKAQMLGEVRYLSEDQAALPRRSIPPLPSFDREPPSTVEKELRRTLCEFVRRGYQQRLLISTEGSFSARLDDDSFLITPYQVDRCNLEPDDVVLVRRGAAEEGKTPSRAARNHAAIYAKHPRISAVVNAYMVNATAFGAVAAVFDPCTIPESYIFLRDVARVPFGVQFQDPQALAALFSERTPAALLENDGALVLGTSILDAFDRLEVLEATAEALINARPLGPVQSMPPSVIDELTAAFLTPKAV